MKKLALYVLLMLALSTYCYAEICKSSPVTYYGYCAPEGDLAVYDSSGNLVEKQAYSQTTGCTKNIYRMVVSGGPGCAVQEGDVLVFKISGKTAGAVAWHSLDSLLFLNISTTGRTFVFVNEPQKNVTVEDEQGVDLTKYGSSGGGSTAQKTVSIKQPVGNTEIEIVKFNTSVNEDRVVDFMQNQSTIFVDLGATNYSEILVPVVRQSGALYVCLASKTMDCSKITIEMGQTVGSLYLEPNYKVINSQKYYVLHGLTFGSVQEIERPRWVVPIILAAALLVVLAVAVLKYKKKR